MNIYLIFLTSLFGFLSPTIAYCGVNAEFFTIRQIIKSIFLMFFLSFLFSFILCYTINIILPITDYNIYNYLLSIFIICLIFCIWSYDLIFSLCKEMSYTICFMLIFSTLLSLSTLIYPYIPLIIFTLYLLFSLYDLLNNIKKRKTLFYKDSYEVKNFSQLNKNINFKYSPNIYLFFLESTHSDQALKKLYNYKGPLITEFLNKKGFQIYPDAHSNADWTMDVRTTLFEMQLSTINPTCSFSGKDKIPLALNILLHNGYHINIFDPSPYVFGLYEELTEYCYFKSQIPQNIKRYFTNFCPLFAQSFLFRLLSNGINPGDPPVTLDDNFDRSRIWNEVMEAAFNEIKNFKKNKSYFNLFYFGQPHTRFYDSKWQMTPSAWKKLYIQKYYNTSNLIEKYIEFIIKEDPNSLIIILGDHGAHLLDEYLLKNENPEKSISEFSLNRNNLFLDIFSNLLAIKWPDYIKPHSFNPCTVNLFLNIFSILSQNKKLLDYYQEDISLICHKFKYLYIYGENGQPLPSMLPFQNYKYYNTINDLRNYLVK